MPITDDQAFLVARSAAYDRDGREIGPVSGIYYDDHTGRPEWVTVTCRSSDATDAAAVEDGPDRFIPLASASYARGRLHLDVTVQQVHEAPVLTSGDHLDGQAETALYLHYGLSPAGDTAVDPDSGRTPRTEDDLDAHSLLPPTER
ncbi:hypothetical protein ACFFKU_14015 [Kineococcus gynurae]|uniref:PRC-barrel domain protein n=1 Tax=Kineococcus gynurae TaxID=452979 RepID=A0ABV5LU54_9ACTN